MHLLKNMTPTSSLLVLRNRLLLLGSGTALCLCFSASLAQAQAPAVGTETVSGAVPPAMAPSEPLTAPVVPSAPVVSAAPAAQRTAAPVAAAPQEKSAGPDVLVAQGKGITITSADKKFQATFRSRIQLRETVLHDGVKDQNYNEAQIKTLRFFATGHALVPELKYFIQLAFGSGDFDKDSPSPIFDAFVEYVKVRDLNIRLGQYFVPFDRARTIREFALQFVDRQGVVRELTLDRDVGLMLYSTDLFGLDGKLAYNLFLGGGDGKNRIADSKNAHGPQTPGMLAVGRLIVRPMGPFDDDMEGDLARSSSPHLAIGAGVGYNLSSNRDHSTYGNTFTLGTFNYLHAAGDLVFKWHGFSLLTEAVVRDANKTQNVGVDDTGAPLPPEYSRSGWGYFAQLGQMVTDQAEVTARWDDLYAKKGTDPAFVSAVHATGRQVGGGFNYYLNGHFLKLQTDYFFLFGDDTSQGSHAARVQLDASF